MLARILPFALLLAGCPDPSATPEAGGMPEQPMGGVPGAEGGQPGGAGGAPPTGAEGGMPNGRPVAPGFKVTTGEGIKLSGTVSYTGSKTGVVRIDFLQQSTQSNFPDLVHSLELAAPGPWEVEAPKDGGDFWVVAFLDADANGPSPGEPAARVKDMVKLASTPITGLDLALSDTPDLGDLAPGGKDTLGAPGGPGAEPKPGEAPPGGEAGAVPAGAPGAVPAGAPGAVPAGAPSAVPAGAVPAGAAGAAPAGASAAPAKPGDVPAAK